MNKLVLFTLPICLAVTIPAFASYGGSPYTGAAVTIPGTIEAENFDNGGEGVAFHDSNNINSGGQYRNTGVDIEAASSGGYDVGWINPGEWMNYTVYVPSAGTYTVQVRIASPNGGAAMHVGFNTASNVWQALSLPATGGWQNWTTVSFTATLGGGIQQMTLWADTGGFNIDSVTVSGGSSNSSGGGLSPYSGSPAPVPGTIEAENFDNGGEGVAYHDTTPGNSGGAYRQSDVDIEAASSGGYDVGWIAPGEFMNYTVNVASAGTYTVQLRVASPYGGAMHVGFNKASNVWQSVGVPNTGGWQNWTTVSFTATLGAGVQQMTLMSDTGNYNIDSIAISAGSSGGGGGGDGGGSTLPVVEWNIQINDTEAHARLAMDMLLASGPRPEVIVIEEAWTANYGAYIDELQRQTGQTWYGAFATLCAPGNWNGSNCTAQWYEGIGIFSTHPILDSGSLYLPYADCWTSARVALRARIDVNGLPVQVFATHLQTGGCANDAQNRYNSMGNIKSWASQFSTPQLLAGDFNADPDQIDSTQGMAPNFTDSFPIAGSGLRFSALGSNPTMKLDYWFSDSSMRATPIISIINAGTGSVSDHFPVETTFVVK